GPFGLEAPFAYAPRVNPNPGQFVRSYRFYSRALNQRSKDLSGRAAGDPAWSAEERAHYLEHPDDSRYTELVAKILETLPPELRDDPFAQATAMQLWLGQNMTYSTAAREKYTNSKDPAGDFLFGDRVGYCVHAATALTYMLRNAGLPSRVGTGYMVEEDQRQGSAVMLTGKDAHAWAEMYLDGVGWLIMDVAPAKNLDAESPPQDPGLVERLAEQARKEPQKESGPQVNVSELFEIAGKIAQWGIVALLLGSTVGVYSWKLWRRLRPLWAGRGALGRVGYRAMIDRLAELGMVRQEGESREAFAKRIQVDGFEELTELHLRSSLAKPTDRLLSHAEWSRAQRRVHQTLQRRPLWRRLLGWLDPSAAFRAR
ncbi:MAG TPA: transglutaminase-like domain-containing protein, partial [Myxococcota bacterium]|nr:transglutaminase-like domain-containing protein [Myxococcota bacterium]